MRVSKRDRVLNRDMDVQYILDGAQYGPRDYLDSGMKTEQEREREGATGSRPLI